MRSSGLFSEGFFFFFFSPQGVVLVLLDILAGAPLPLRCFLLFAVV